MNKDRDTNHSNAENNKIAFENKKVVLAGSMLQQIEPRYLYDAALGAELASAIDQQAITQVVDNEFYTVNSSMSANQTVDSFVAEENQHDAYRNMINSHGYVFQQQHDQLEHEYIYDTDVLQLKQDNTTYYSFDKSLVKEIIFVDSAVNDYAELLEGIELNKLLSGELEVVLIHQDQSGVEQISDYLKQYRNQLESVHVVSHGDIGQLQLGSDLVNQNNLFNFSNNITDWGISFVAGADLLFYGCNVAEGTLGQKFVKDLHHLVDADVAASSDITGNRLLSGDWDLEVSHGDISTNIAFNNYIQDNYSGVLATYIVTNSHSSGEGSFAEALQQANASNDHDIIRFAEYKTDGTKLAGILSYPQNINVSTDLTLIGNYQPGDTPYNGNNVTNGDAPEEFLILENNDNSIVFDNNVINFTMQNMYFANYDGLKIGDNVDSFILENNYFQVWDQGSEVNNDEQFIHSNTSNIILSGNTFDYSDSYIKRFIKSSGDNWVITDNNFNFNNADVNKSFIESSGDNWNIKNNTFDLHSAAVTQNVFDFNNNTGMKFINNTLDITNVKTDIFMYYLNSNHVDMSGNTINQNVSSEAISQFILMDYGDSNSIVDNTITVDNISNNKFVINPWLSNNLSILNNTIERTSGDTGSGSSDFSGIIHIEGDIRNVDISGNDLFYDMDYNRSQKGIYVDNVESTVTMTDNLIYNVDQAIDIAVNVNTPVITSITFVGNGYNILGTTGSGIPANSRLDFYGYDGIDNIQLAQVRLGDSEDITANSIYNVNANNFDFIIQESISGNNYITATVTNINTGVTSELSNAFAIPVDIPDAPIPTTPDGDIYREFIETDASLSDTGVFTVESADAPIGISVVNTMAEGATNLLAIQYMQMFDVIPGMTSVGDSQDITWHFDSASPSENFDYLNTGESLTLTYKIMMTKSSGDPLMVTDVDFKDVVIKINGETFSETSVLAGSLTEDDESTGGLVTIDANSTYVIDTVGSPLSSVNGHGTYTIDSNGKWTYTLTDDLDYLSQDESLTDYFYLSATNSLTAANQLTAEIISTPVEITITGVNDLPVLEPDTLNVQEDITIISNEIDLLANDSDPDAADNPFITSVSNFKNNEITTTGTLIGKYGTLEWLNNGNYTYVLDNTLADVQSLNTDTDALTDVFNYFVTSGDDNQQSTLTINITGNNDNPEIVLNTGDTDSFLANENNSIITSGNLSISDPDDISTIPTINIQGVSISSPIIDNNAALAMFELGALTGPTGTDYSFTWTFNSNGQTFDYLRQGETEVITYTIRVADTHGGFDDHNVTITINGINDTSTIGGMHFDSIDEDFVAGEQITQNLTIDDLDFAENQFIEIANQVGTYGTFDLEKDGKWTYTRNNNSLQELDNNEFKTDTFSVSSADGESNQDVTVRITGIDDAPIALESNVTLLEDNNVYVFKQDDFMFTDPENHSITSIDILESSLPQNGMLYLNNKAIEPNTTIDISVISNGVLKYIPFLDFNGQDEFMFTVNNDLIGVVPAPMKITVTATPDTVDDYYFMDEDAELIFNKNNLVFNDLFSNIIGIDDITFGVPTANAALEMVDPTDPDYTPGAVRLTPAQNYNGVLSFDYFVLPSAGTQETGTVFVTVNPVSDVVDDSFIGDFSVVEDIGVALGTPDYNLLLNDNFTAVDGTISYTQGLYGSVVVDNNGDFSYMPIADFYGADTFTYTVTVDVQSEMATVTIDVTSAVDAEEDSTISVLKNIPHEFNVLQNDSFLSSVQVIDVSNPIHGVVSISGSGNLVYSADKDYVGTDTFNYTVLDGSGNIEQAIVNLNIVDLTYTPGARPDFMVGQEDDGALTVDALENDIFVLPISYQNMIIAQPEHGTVAIVDDPTATNAEGKVLSYVPDSDFSGLDHFTYTLGDSGITRPHNNIDVYVHVQPANDIVTDAAFITSEDGSIINSVNLLENDSFNNKNISLNFSQPIYGNFTNINSNISYTPSFDFYGNDTIYYAVQLDNTDIEYGSFEVNIESTQDAVAVELLTTENTDVVIDVIKDSSFESALVNTQVTAVTQGQYGTVTFTPQGEVTYSPFKDFTGLDSFTYLVTTPGGFTESETINVTVENKGFNVAGEVTQVTEDSLDNVINVFASKQFGKPTDLIDVNNLASGEVSTEHGTLTFEPKTGEVSYTPLADYYGKDRFIYTVETEQGVVKGSVEIMVLNINDLPVSTPQSTDLAFQEDPLPTTSGNITIDDVDWTDKVYASVEYNSSDNAGTYDGSFDGGDLLVILTPNPIIENADIYHITGDIDWEFNKDPNNHQSFNFLAEDQTLILNYNIAIDDGNGRDVSHPLIITITGQNDTPVARHNYITAIEDTDQTVSGNFINDVDDNDLADSDVDTGDSISVVSITKDGLIQQDQDNTNLDDENEITGIHGTLRWLATGEYYYDVDQTDPEVEGLQTSSDKIIDEFSYTINDLLGAESQANLIVTIEGKNDLPITLESNVAIDENSSYLFRLTDFEFTDVDYNESLQAIMISDTPSAGNLFLNGEVVTINQNITADEIPELTYTPAADWDGVVTFDFIAVTSLPAAEPNTITIVVNNVPNDQNDIISLLADGTVGIGGSGGGGDNSGDFGSGAGGIDSNAGDAGGDDIGGGSSGNSANSDDAGGDSTGEGGTGDSGESGQANQSGNQGGDNQGNLANIGNSPSTSGSDGSDSTETDSNQAAILSVSYGADDNNDVDGLLGTMERGLFSTGKFSSGVHLEPTFNNLSGNASHSLINTGKVITGIITDAMGNTTTETASGAAAGGAVAGAAAASASSAGAAGAGGASAGGNTLKSGSSFGDKYARQRSLKREKICHCSVCETLNPKLHKQKIDLGFGQKL